MSDIRTLALGIDGSRMSSGAAQAVAATDQVAAGAARATKSVDGLQGVSTSAGGSMLRFASTLQAVSVAALAVKFQQSINELDAIAKLAAKLKEPLSDVQSLVIAAENANVSFDAVKTSVKAFTLAIDGARAGNKDLQSAFAEVGVGMEAVSDRSIDLTTRIDTVAAGYRAIGDPIRQAAIANALFGRSSTEVQGLLESEANAITRVKDTLRANGGLASESDAAHVAAYKDAITGLGQAFDRLAYSLAPALDLLKGVTDFAAKSASGLANTVQWISAIGVALSAAKNAAMQASDPFAAFGSSIDQQRTAASAQDFATRERLAREKSTGASPEASAQRHAEATKRIKEETDANKKASESLDELLRGYQQEAEMLGLEGPARLRAIELQKLDNAARDKTTGTLRVEQYQYDYLVQQIDAYVEAVTRSSDAQKQANEERERAKAAFDAEVARELRGIFAHGELVETLQREAEAIGKTADERELAEAQRRAWDAGMLVSIRTARDNVDEITKLVLALQSKRKAQDDSTAADKQAREEADRLAASQRAQREEADRALDDLRQETALIGRSNYERERARALRDFDRRTGDLPSAEASRRRGEYEAALAERNTRAAYEHVRQLQLENELLGKTAEERRKIVELRQFENEFGPGEVEGARAALEAYQASREELERMDRLSVGIADNLVRGLEDALYSARSLGDVLQSLSRLGFSEFLGGPLRGAISSGLFGLFGGGNTITSGDGNAFSGGRLHAFGNGGLFSGPTLMPLGGGDMGLFGEDPSNAGEAAVPLTRTRSGKLGVRMEGGGTVVHQEVHFHGGADIYGGVARSTRQALQGARDAVN